MQINSYDTNPNESIDYYTVICNNNTINYNLDKEIYRTNLERYKEDANILGGSGAASDEDKLSSAPLFSVEPYKNGKDIFVPAEEFLNALGLEVEISDK